MSGWRRYGNYCYLRVTTKRTWYAARSYCQRQKASLVSIRNKAENSFVRRLHRGTSWIGYNDIRREKQFVWTDGSKGGCKFWNNGEPNNAGNEDCTEIGVNNDKWNDAKCSQNKPFTCKKKAGKGTFYELYFSKNNQ